MRDTLLVLVFTAVIAPKVAKHFKEMKALKANFKKQNNDRR